jgi:putative inorganic carbon (HCO3(-)) transporter
MKSVCLHVSERGREQFWAMMALIVYTPLPLASNRPWALALLGVLTGCLLLWSIWRPGGRSADFVWRSARVPLKLLGLWMLLLAVQLVPLPGSWMDVMGQRAVFDQQGGGSITIDSYSTRLYLAKACILSASFWLVVTLVNSRRRIEWLATVIVFSGLLQALLGVLLMAGGANFHLFFVEMEYSKAHGTFVSPNQYAGYLELTLAVGIGLMVARLDGRALVNWRQRLYGWLAVLLSGKAMLRLALVIMVVGLVASRSRMGNSAFFASLLIVGVFAVAFSKHAVRTTVVFIVSLIVLDVVVIGGMVGVEQVVQRIESTNLQMQVERPAAVVNTQKFSSEVSVEQRSEAARAAVQIVRDFPWLGTGGGTFYLSFPHYRPAQVYGFLDHAHNDYAEFASESGLSGFLLLALMVMHSVFQSLKLLVRSHNQLSIGMAFASLMGIVSLLIHGTVDFNFQNPANAMLFLILLSFPYLQTMLKR